MTKATHTPGPWFADFHNERRDGGRFVTMILAGNYLVPIAAVPSGVEGYGREEGRANAALIAAAPAMLAALRALANALRDNRTLTRADCSVLEGEARAAIAAATGTPTGEGGHPIPAAQQGEG